METLPEQDELRRRLRAARALHDLTVERLAERIPAELRLGVRTLRKLESGERPLTEELCRQLATYVGVPFEWFTVPDVGEAVAARSAVTFSDRIAALETSQAALWAEVQRARGQGAARRERPTEDDGPSASARRRRGRQTPVQ